MKLVIEFSDADVRHVREVMAAQSNVPLLRQRQIPPVRMPDRDELWQAQLMCLLTTQNKSSTGSVVDAFLSREPFPLTLDACREHSDQIANFIYKVFESEPKRPRRWKLVAAAAAENFRRLENGGWPALEAIAANLLALREQSSACEIYHSELDAATHMREHYRGFGPKQSRNFWQYLGLTRHVIPIDSRVITWLHTNLELQVPSGALSDEGFYVQIEKAIGEICAAAETLPCLFDAAVFSLKEPTNPGALAESAPLDDEND